MMNMTALIGKFWEGEHQQREVLIFPEDEHGRVVRCPDVRRIRTWTRWMSEDPCGRPLPRSWGRVGHMILRQSKAMIWKVCNLGDF
jgi:hypothetical protein